MVDDPTRPGYNPKPADLPTAPAVERGVDDEPIVTPTLRASDADIKPPAFSTTPLLPGPGYKLGGLI